MASSRIDLRAHDLAARRIASFVLANGGIWSNQSGKGEIRDWETLIGDGSVRRLILSVDDVNAALRRHIKPERLYIVSAGDFEKAAADAPNPSAPAKE